MAVRSHHNPWLLPGIAWALLSAVVGLSHAKSHGWTGIWIGVALVGAGIATALVFAVVSVSAGWLLFRIAESRDRPANRKGGGDSGAG